MNTARTARTVIVDDNRDTVLDTIAGHISAAHQDALAASLLAEEDEPSRRRIRVQRARDAAQSAGHALARLGALGARPAHVPSREPFPPFPSYLLDTMARRRLLALLEEAQIIAERVDGARGRTISEDVALQPGESRGTDLAESISEIALRVRTEVHGPKGATDYRPNDRPGGLPQVWVERVDQ